MTLSISHLSKAYRNRAVLRDFSLQMDPGEVHLLVGPSGTGKTTLLRCLALLEPADTGTIALAGKQYGYIPTASRAAWQANHTYRTETALTFQQLFMWPHLTLRESISRTMRSDFQIEPLAEFLQIGPVLERFPNQVSLGQRQRAAFIRTVSTRANYFFFDEITSALDDTMTLAVSEVLGRLADSGKSILLVTHTPDRLGPLKDRSQITRLEAMQ